MNGYSYECSPWIGRGTPMARESGEPVGDSAADHPEVLGRPVST